MVTKQKIAPDTWVKLGVYVAGGIAVAFGVKKVLDYFKPERKRTENEGKQVINELQQSEKTQKASYPDSVYSGWASAIAFAVFGYGYNAKTIFDIFRKLKNNTDYLKLIKAWGSPARQVFPDFFIFYDTGYKMTLPELLRYQMSSKEITQINQILASKGIKYRI